MSRLVTKFQPFKSHLFFDQLDIKVNVADLKSFVNNYVNHLAAVVSSMTSYDIL